MREEYDRIHAKIAASCQANAERKLRELLDVADLKELRNERISIKVLPRTDPLASLRAGITSWEVGISTDLLVAGNFLFCLHFDDALLPEMRRTLLLERMKAAVSGGRIERHVTFPWNRSMEIGLLGGYVNSFAMAHELGHIIILSKGNAGMPSTEVEIQADHWGWLLHYGRAMMAVPPFDELFAARKIATNWDRWEFIRAEVAGGRSMEELTPVNRRAEAYWLQHYIFLGPCAFFRLIEYHEAALKSIGIPVESTHPPAIVRRLTLLEGLPEQLKSMVVSKTLDPFDASIPPP
jgi:hypothetical protein